MAFDERFGSNAVAILPANMLNGAWEIMKPAEITNDPYELDYGTITLCKFSGALAANATCKQIIDTWAGKTIPGYSYMYATAVTARLMPGGLWVADITIKGCASAKKYCRQTDTTSLKEMTVKNGDKTEGYNAITPSCTREYISGTGITTVFPPMPSSPPGFWFYGEAKTNSPSGWIKIDASASDIDGTPYKKVIEKWQWIHSAEPASS